MHHIPGTHSTDKIKDVWLMWTLLHTNATVVCAETRCTGSTPNQLQQQPFLLPHLLMWHSSTFCPQPYTFCHVHHPTKYAHLISITQPSPVWRRHTAFLLFYPPNLHSSISHLQSALQEISSWMTAKSTNSQLLQNWISSHRTQTTTSQDTKLLSQHHPLCSQSRLHLWSSSSSKYL